MILNESNIILLKFADLTNVPKGCITVNIQEKCIHIWANYLISNKRHFIFKKVNNINYYYCYFVPFFWNGFTIKIH